MISTKTYRKIKKSVIISQHPSYEELVDFLLTEQPQNGETNWNYEKISNHLLECDLCQEAVWFLKSELVKTDTFLNKTIRPEKIKYTLKLPQWISKPVIRYSFATITVLMISYYSIYIYQNLSIPIYIKLGEVSVEKDFGLSRGSSSEYYNEALLAINREDINNAIALLEDEVRNSAENDTVFYSEYVLGMLYLKTAVENNFFGDKTIHEEKIDLAVEHFNNAISSIDSSIYKNIFLDIHWYLGKSFLLKNDLQLAASHFSAVVNGKGSKMKEAILILREISQKN